MYRLYVSMAHQAKGKPWHESDECRAIVPIVCFVCRILSVVTAGRVPHGVRQRRGEWLADGRPPARLFPAAPGANRWTQRYCCRIVAVRAGGMEPDTLCGPVARQGLRLALWQRWQQGRWRHGPHSLATLSYTDPSNASKPVKLAKNCSAMAGHWWSVSWGSKLYLMNPLLFVQV